jgi:hypothetical protein
MGGNRYADALIRAKAHPARQCEGPGRLDRYLLRSACPSSS